MKSKVIVFLTIILLILSSCSLPSTDIPTYTQAPTSAPTDTPHVTFTPTPEPTPETVDMLCGYVTLSDSSSCLNLRSEPSSSSQIIEPLPNGTQLVILEEQDQWYKVQINNHVGYVSHDYVGNVGTIKVLVNTPTPEPATNTPDNSHTIWVNVDSLNIRSQPNTNSEVLGSIHYGESTQGSYSGDWMHTTYNGVSGYIYLGKSDSGRTCVVYSAAALATATPISRSNSNSSVYVYITKTGTKYHTGSCGYLHSSKIKVTLDDAIRRGYTPCSRCHPP